MNKFKVKVNGGYLIAVESADPQNPGIAIEYETEQGDIIDVAYTEVKGEDGNKDIDVYTYEDVTTDEYSKHFRLLQSDIQAALY